MMKNETEETTKFKLSIEESVTCKLYMDTLRHLILELLYNLKK
jgi:hypothetical protein